MLKHREHRESQEVSMYGLGVCLPADWGEVSIKVSSGVSKVKEDI